MGNVVISPNIHKTSERIDPTGNIINAKTKEIIKPVEPEFISPTPEPNLDTIIANKPSKKSKIDEMIDTLVAKKVEEMVAQKVEEALKNL